MSLKVIYVTIVWIPGNLAFANKTRKIYDDKITDPHEVAMGLLEDKAIRLKEKTMTKDPLSSIMEDMYYEVFNSAESRKPSFKSMNAP